jgi:hypothetical protein
MLYNVSFATHANGGSKKDGVKLTIGLGHAQTKARLSLNGRRKETFLLAGCSKVHHGWAPYRITAAESPDNAKIAATSNFVNANQVVKSIPFFRFDTTR